MTDSIPANLYLLKPESTESGPVVDTHDRITDAYQGKLGKQFMLKTQKRIHWICKQVQGQRVLDVGCSQGITAILLAREGKTVIGIDIDDKAMAEARAYLMLEAPQVQNRVKLIQGDVIFQDLAAERFDVVVLGEVLEQFIQPERLIDIAMQWLGPGGRLVVTVPFGINDFFDHKRTFYLFEPYELIANHCVIREMVLMDNWVGIVANRREVGDAQPSGDAIYIDIIRKLEAGIFSLEQALREDIESVRNQLHDANTKYKTATGQLSEANTKYKTLTELVDSLKQQLSQVEAAKKEAESFLAQLRVQLQETLQKEQQEHITGITLRSDLRISEVKLQQAVEQLDQLRLKLTEAESQGQAREEELGDLRRKLTLAEQSGIVAVTNLAESEQRAELERLALTERMQGLREELQTRQASAHEAEKQAVRLEADLGFVRQQMEEDRAKYFAGAEQIAFLKEQVQQAEAAYNAQIQVTNELTDKLHQAEAQIASLWQALEQLELLRLKLAEAESQGFTREKELADLRLKLTLAEQSGIVAVTNLAESEQRAELERLALTERMQGLREELQTRQASAYETEQKAVCLESDLAHEHQRLEEANAKYLAGMAEIASLEEQVRQTETAYDAQTQIAYELTDKLHQKDIKIAWLQQAMEQLNQLRLKLLEAESLRQAREEELSTLRFRLVLSEQSAIVAASKLADLEQHSARDRSDFVEQIQSLKMELQARQAIANEAERKSIRLKEDLSNIRRRLEEADAKSRVSSEMIDFFKEQVQQAEAAYDAQTQIANELTDKLSKAEARLASLRQASEQLEQLQLKQAEAESRERAREEELTGLEQRANLDRSTFTEQIQNLREELQTRQLIAHETEKQTLRLEADLVIIRRQLEDANEKSRISTEMIDFLKKQVLQDEVLHNAQIQTTNELRDKLRQAEALITSIQQSHKQAVADWAERLRETEERNETDWQALQREISKVADDVPKLKTQLADSNAKYRQSQERAGRKEEIAQLRRELGDKLETLAKLDEQVRAQQAASVEAEKSLSRLQIERQTLMQGLDEANAKYQQSTEQYDALKQRLSAVQTSHDASEAVVQDLKMRLADSEKATEQERAGRKEEVAQLRKALDDKLETFARLDEQVRGQQAAYVEVKKSHLLLQTERDALTQRLEEANAKYRETTEKYDVLRQRLQLAETKSKNHESSAAGLQAHLDEERRAHEATQEALGKRSSEARTLIALRRGQDHALRQLQLQMLKASQRLKESELIVEQVRQQKISAEHQVAKTRATLSFQLGYLLIHGFKSFHAFWKLPGALWELHKEAGRRQAAKQQRNLALSSPALDNAAVMVEQRSSTARGARLIPPTLDVQIGTAADLKELKIACIMDEFTFSLYQAECNLQQLAPQHWKAELKTFQPKLLFIESAWRGKDELWVGKVGNMSRELQDIIAWCRKHNVPTVFWNKEDPVHLQTFLNTAKLFDHVFTTDIDCVHRYKEYLGHDRVYLLPFAMQPSLSNPIEVYERKDAFCFAGAYYVRYPERSRDLGNFVSQLSEVRPVEIYDRNFGKNDPNYQFPPEYHPFIVGHLPFDQIDKAYKGYRYGINLNSIKQSQSMFSRRVFELLASNTITVSNFSRGLRLIFGDLVVTTDSAAEILRRLTELGQDEAKLRKFRLAALRKVMAEHTYQDRLAYVIAKVQGTHPPALLPAVVIAAYVQNQEQFDFLLQSYSRQTYEHKCLCIVTPGGLTLANIPDDGRVRIWPAPQIQDRSVAELLDGVEWITGMTPVDYYGPNYLYDLALATRYSDVSVIGKATHYVWSNSDGLKIAFAGQQYKKVRFLPARASLVKSKHLASLPLREWVTTLYTRQVDAGDTAGLAIDEFNYCKNGNASGFAEDHQMAVNDLAGMDLGIKLQELLTRAERISSAELGRDNSPYWPGSRLAGLFNMPGNQSVQFDVRGSVWHVKSSLLDGNQEYFYAATDLRPGDLGFDRQARIHFDVSPGLNLQLAILFLDAQKQRIGHVVRTANGNHEDEIPEGAAWVRLGLRIYAAGEAEIRALAFGHRSLSPAIVVGRAEHLILTNEYPSYADLYRNGFIHRRLVNYRQRGVMVDLFRLHPAESMSYSEFQNVDCIAGSQEALQRLLSTGQYQCMLVHFLDEAMWEVLKHYIERVKIIVWVHGAEIQPYHRRDFNYKTEQEHTAAKAMSAKRMAFWRGLLQPMPANLKLVFVSRYFAEEVMEDLGFRIPDAHYTVIHNPIDTELFCYKPKPPEQRKKILSIRPYASAKYANDLSVKAILALSAKPWFEDLEFRMIGDGPLFDETLAPLRGFNNIIIEQRFLTQAEIARIHQSYGVFLCPTRMDAQGVSRDEAMASGLVPVTNKVAAIPEFVDETCGILASAEDSSRIADGIERLYNEPETFISMSEHAERRVRRQSCYKMIITDELELLNETTRESMQ
ncbi:MAG: methyltransferase domain-containing protein [Deltaproteobacteria bacterium]|nr:methyltransferase domain-containing protein [Deltaproteobacteria bacterium]